MESFVDGPARRVAHRLRFARVEAEELARRRRCEDCGMTRRCARLEPLAWPEHWYCLSECWAYRLGVLHGGRLAIREARAALEEIPLFAGNGARRPAAVPVHNRRHRRTEA